MTKQIKKYSIAYLESTPSPKQMPKKIELTNLQFSFCKIKQYILVDQKNIRGTSVFIIKEEKDTPGIKKKVKEVTIAMFLLKSFLDIRYITQEVSK